MLVFSRVRIMINVRYLGLSGRRFPAFTSAPRAYAEEREMRMSGNQTGRRSGARRNLRIGAVGTLAVVAASVMVTAAIAGTAPTKYARAGSRLVVTTADGSIRGKPAGAMDEFLGLPYAAPPTGPLRWRPPHPPARWRGIREATQFAPHCPQPTSYFGVASTSENCLYLNVFVPSAGSNHPLPRSEERRVGKECRSRGSPYH